MTGLFGTETVAEGSPKERVLWVLSDAGRALVDALPDLGEVAQAGHEPGWMA